VTETYVIGDKEYRDWPTAVVLSAATIETLGETSVLELYRWLFGEGADADYLTVYRCQQELFSQFPKLVEASEEAKDGLTDDNWEDWLMRWTGRYGSSFPVSRVLQ
jgi:hypothetical protein